MGLNFFAALYISPNDVSVGHTGRNPLLARSKYWA